MTTKNLGAVNVIQEAPKPQGVNLATQTQRTITVTKHLGRVVGECNHEEESVQGVNHAQPRNLNATKDVGRVVGEKGDKGDTGEGVIPGGNPGQVLGKKTSADYDTEWKDESPGATSWSELTGKPFNTLDTTTLKVVNNVLSVNTVDSATIGNIQPITSNAVKNEVNTAVGNIEVLLSII